MGIYNKKFHVMGLNAEFNHIQRVYYKIEVEEGTLKNEIRGNVKCTKHSPISLGGSTGSKGIEK